MTDLDRYRQLKAAGEGDDMVHLFQIDEFWEAFEQDAELLIRLIPLPRMFWEIRDGLRNDEYATAWFAHEHLDDILDRIGSVGLHVTAHGERSL